MCQVEPAKARGAGPARRAPSGAAGAGASARRPRRTSTGRSSWPTRPWPAECATPRRSRSTSRWGCTMAKGFFTDTTVCIGCKACQVACHQWNELPALNDGHAELTGDSYDNTGRLNAVRLAARAVHRAVPRGPDQDGSGSRWLMMSTCASTASSAGCLEVCPTGAIIRTEFDSVYIQQDVCNGCRDCIAGLPVRRRGHERATARRTSARSATTGCSTAWSRPAPRPARPTRSGSATCTS